MQFLHIYCIYIMLFVVCYKSWNGWVSNTLEYSFNLLKNRVIPRFCLYFQVDHILDPIQLFTLLLLLGVSLTILSTVTELSQVITNQFEMFNNELDQCAWYAFHSMKMQQILMIVMANAQQPTFIRGFGNIPCTRETFKKVILSSLIVNCF